MQEFYPVWLALLGTGFTFFMTALGAAVVFFVRDSLSDDIQSSFLGFAAGIMIAASVWSLLMPAMDYAEQQGQNTLLVTAAGFLLGGLFLFALDKTLPHLHAEGNEREGIRTGWSRTTLLVLAVTLHNVPEGLAVGLTFGLAGLENQGVTLGAAMVLALGMGLQNFPEGAAISLPLRREGCSKGKSFTYGALSGVVEPIAGVIGALLAESILTMMPILLSFAAGAMIYVVVEDLIPQAHLGRHSHAGTIGVMLGFVIMMMLDIGLA